MSFHIAIIITVRTYTKTASPPSKFFGGNMDKEKYKQYIQTLKKEVKKLTEKGKSVYIKIKPKAESVVGSIKNIYEINPKLLPVILMFVGVVALLSFPTLKMNQLKRIEQIELKTSMKQYGINKNTVFEEISIYDIDDTGDYVLHVCSPDSIYCQQYTPILYEAGEENKITIKYIDLSKLRPSEKASLQKTFSQCFEKEVEAPATIFIKNGMPFMAQKKDKTTIEGQKLSDKQKLNLLNSYNKGIANLKE